jgi:hypothetical protein
MEFLMQRQVLPGLLSVAVLLATTVCRAGDGWHSDGIIDGVQVEHRDVAGSRDIWSGTSRSRSSSVKPRTSGGLTSRSPFQSCRTATTSSTAR